MNPSTYQAVLFDVDGVLTPTAALHARCWKQAPDGFLEVARRPAVAPTRAVVVEDALAGVAAGPSLGLGLVISVARSAARAELRSAGADIVVADLAEMMG